MKILEDPDPQHCFNGTINITKIPKTMRYSEHKLFRLAASKVSLDVNNSPIRDSWGGGDGQYPDGED
jgi:hypothetical protein